MWNLKDLLSWHKKINPFMKRMFNSLYNKEKMILLSALKVVEENLTERLLKNMRRLVN